MIRTSFAYETGENTKAEIFNINAIDWCNSDEQSQINKRHIQKEYECIWVQQGTGIQIIDGNNYTVNADTVFCIVPGQLHQFKIDPGLRAVIISFSAHFICDTDSIVDSMYDLNMFKHLSACEGIDVSKVNDKISMIIALLLSESSADYPLKSQVIRRYLKILLVYIFREFKRIHHLKDHENGNATFKRFMELVENNYKHKKSVFEYAKELSITPNYLNEVVKKYSGYSAGYIIRQRIIREARHKAVYSNFTMKETAYAVGFEDVCYFSRFFKKESGMNYSIFKRTYRSNKLLL